MGLLLVFIVVDVLAFWGLWYVMFKDWDDFTDSIRYILTPDIVSLFRGEAVEDFWAEMKAGIWVLLCLSLVVSEYFQFFR